MAKRGRGRTRNHAEPPVLLARGDVVSFDIKDDSPVELPKDFVMLHDPTGRFIDKCTLVCCRCTFSARPVHHIPDAIRGYVDDYFGSDTELAQGEIVLPRGPWQRVGVVVEVRYDRHGQYEDAFYHPFHASKDSPVELFRQARGTAYLLLLQSGCRVDERGFVTP